MSRPRVVAIAATVCTALTAQQAIAASTKTTTTATAPLSTTTTPTTTTPTTTTTPPTTTTTPAQPPSSGVTVTPAPVPQPAPYTPHPPQSNHQGKGGSGGTHNSKNGKGSKHGGDKSKGGKSKAKGKGNGTGGSASAPLAPAGPAPGGVAVPGLGLSCTTGASAPAYLLPIYQQAADAYGLGPQGPGVLAAINGIESGFGANLGPSSAGAVGWMQFLPSTWAIYGVDANGDGTADPNNPQDAIFAAARYLQAAGMPADTAGAIFAYNHADWYVAEVLASAGCYGGILGGFGVDSGPQQVSCQPAPHSHIPADYLLAFEDAAQRYELGQRGVWALAAVGRLESEFGRGMTSEQMISTGPLGLDRSEWNRFEVDGDGDGRVLHADIQDAAATLAREIWSRGDLRSGLFLHNQGEWYVQQVLQQASQLSGDCRIAAGAWSLSLPQTSASMDWTDLALGPRQQAPPWDTTLFDGVRVCSYMVPILQSARALGWQGHVVSGYRTYAEQARIHASGVFSAAPGESNHEGCLGGTQGPGNGAVDVTDPGSFAVAMPKLGYPLRNTLGAIDPEHFSPGGN